MTSFVTIGMVCACMMAARKRPRESYLDWKHIIEVTNAQARTNMKGLALTCGYPDQTQLYKALKQDAPLDLHALQLATDDWWERFCENVLAARRALRLDLKPVPVKADLRPRAEREIA